MNRSRETMQFIQALSAPTRASFSLYLEYKELLAFIPVIPTASVHRLPTGLLPSILSFQSSRVRISTRHNNRNSKRIDLLPPFPLNIVPLFFRMRREEEYTKYTNNNILFSFYFQVCARRACWREWSKNVWRVSSTTGRRFI